jgi:hypothetical protein
VTLTEFARRANSVNVTETPDLAPISFQPGFMLRSARYRLRESGVNPELSRSGKQERTP